LNFSFCKYYSFSSQLTNLRADFYPNVSIFWLCSSCSDIMKYWVISQLPGLYPTPVWSNWRPAGHMWPKTTCNQAREIICCFVTSYYNFIYFLCSEGSEIKKIVVLSRLLFYIQVPHMLLN
jgi:hypothetical protein